MNPGHDFYEILGVPPTVSDQELKRAYRALALRTHPDQGGNAALFALVEQSYATLSDPVLRAEYDRSRTSPPTPPLSHDQLEEVYRQGLRDAASFYDAPLPSPPPSGVPDAERDQRRLRRVALTRISLYFAALAAAAQLSRVLGLPSRLGAPDALTERLDPFLAAANPLPAFVLAAVFLTAVFHNHNWVLIAKLPHGALRGALAGSFFAALCLAEALVAWPARVVVLLSGALAGAVSAALARRGGAVIWEIGP